MRVKVEHDFIRDAMKVWFFTRRNETAVTVHRMVGDDQWQDEDVPSNGLMPEPSVVLRRDMLEALVAAASDVLPPSGAQSAHLADAITIRDRLLTLVEKGADRAAE